MDKIFIRGLEFYGYHGVFAAERELGQRFRVDVECFLDLEPAGQSDRLEETVNYAEVVQLIQRIMEIDPPVKLLETLAERICRSLFDAFPIVKAVQLRIVKPDPPIPGHYESVGVEVFRKRP